MRLLLTRPEPDAERTAAVLRARGHTVILASLMHIEAVPGFELSAGPWAAILVTSANAARAIALDKHRDTLRAVPVLAVGERSAQAMRTAGFTTVISADGSVGDLSRLAAERIRPGAALLYLAGAERSGDLAGELRQRNFAVDVVEVYRAVVAATLPPAAADALAGGVDGVLHFSRRSVEAYLKAASAAGISARALRTSHFCLSDRVAEPLMRAGAADIRVAPRPVEGALIELIGPAPG